MSTGGVSHEDIYLEILSKLIQVGASDTASTIRTTVARGIVLDGGDTSATKTHRPMDGQESLAVALEYVVSVLEVPLMIQSVSNTFENQNVSWRPEGTVESRDSIASPILSSDGQEGLRRSLQKVVEIDVQLGIRLPEIA